MPSPVCIELRVSIINEVQAGATRRAVAELMRAGNEGVAVHRPHVRSDPTREGEELAGQDGRPLRRVRRPHHRPLYEGLR